MKEDITKAIEVLQEGGIILYPTDTVWGIGCDATNEDAVKKIFDIKQRADSKAMLVLLDNENRLSSYIDEVPEIAWELLDVANKPLTVIYPGAKNVSNLLVADDGSLGIRIAKDEFCQQLIQRFKKPLVSTSANISGEPTPQFYNEISDQIVNQMDYVVDYRQDDTTKREPSGIIKLNERGQFIIIRK